MEYKLRLDTDELQKLTKNIDDTSSEIINVIGNFDRINNNLTNGWKDETGNEFTNTFGLYIKDLKQIGTFYSDLTTRIKKYTNNYETTDLDLAKKLREEVDKDE